MANAKRTCTFPACDRPHNSHSLCQGHDIQRRQGKVLTPLRTVKLVGTDPDENFWPRVDVRGAEECWPWIGPKNDQGYGMYGPKRAHRTSYAITYGKIPDGMQIDHKCRNRICVNPLHLQAASNKVNHENLGVYRSSTSGIRGVGWDKTNKQWFARVSHNGRPYWGGRHDNIEDAERAAIALRNQLFTNNLADR